MVAYPALLPPSHKIMTGQKRSLRQTTNDRYSLVSEATIMFCDLCYYVSISLFHLLFFYPSIFLLPLLMSALSDVSTGSIRLKIGVNIGYALPQNEFVLDAVKRVPFPKNLGS
jgi:hypothetical protein